VHGLPPHGRRQAGGCPNQILEDACSRNGPLFVWKVGEPSQLDFLSHLNACSRVKGRREAGGGTSRTSTPSLPPRNRDREG
jgi:hypothetical protein